MTTINNNFDDIILNRRSIRKYQHLDITDDTIQKIFAMALRAPSSKNYQPWTFRIIKTKAAKDKYSQLFIGNRSQYETASAMIIILVDTRYAARADVIYDKAIQAGVMSLESKEKQMNNIKNNHPNPMDIVKTAYLNAGMVAMNLMLAARHFGLDTCPIAGFDRPNAPQAFNLEHHEAVLAISIGIADDLGYPSVRLDFDEVAKIE